MTLQMTPQAPKQSLIHYIIDCFRSISLCAVDYRTLPSTITLRFIVTYILYPTIENECIDDNNDDDGDDGCEDDDDNNDGNKTSRYTK